MLSSSQVRDRAFVAKVVSVLGDERDLSLRTKLWAATQSEQDGWLLDTLDLQCQVLEVMRRRRGVDHRDTIDVEYAAAKTLYRLRWWSKALPLFDHVALVWQQRGPDDAGTLNAKAWAAVTLGKLDHFDRSIQILRGVVDDFRRLNGPDDQLTIRTMSRLAAVLGDSGDLTAAIEIHRDVLDADTRLLGPDDPETLKALRDLAIALAGRGDAAEAKILATSLLARQTALRGLDAPDTRYARSLIEQIDNLE